MKTATKETHPPPKPSNRKMGAPIRSALVPQANLKASKLHPQRKLSHPESARSSRRVCSRNLSKAAVGNVHRRPSIQWRSKVRMVEHVESIRPELQVDAPVRKDRKRLPQPHVLVDKSRPTQRIPCPDVE